MNTLITCTIVILIFYILPMMYNFYWVRRSHYHPRGINKQWDPDSDDYLFTFCPILNIIGLIMCIITASLEKDKKKDNIFKPNNLKDET